MAPAILIPAVGEAEIDYVRPWSQKAGGPRGCHWDTQNQCPEGHGNLRNSYPTLFQWAGDNSTLILKNE